MDTLCSACGKVKSRDHVCKGMADTPLINAKLFSYGNRLDGDYKEEGIEPEFARTLERENATLKEEVAEVTHLLDMALCINLDADRERSDSLQRAETSEATADGYREALETINANSLNPALTLTKLGLEEVTAANFTVSEQALKQTKES